MPFSDPARARRDRMERYAHQKEHGVCVQCVAADARPGRTMCAPCAARKAADSRDRYRRRIEERRAARIDAARAGLRGAP